MIYIQKWNSQQVLLDRNILIEFFYLKISMATPTQTSFLVQSTLVFSWMNIGFWILHVISNPWSHLSWSCVIESSCLHCSVCVCIHCNNKHCLLCHAKVLYPGEWHRSVWHRSVQVTASLEGPQTSYWPWGQWCFPCVFLALFSVGW